MSQSVDPDHFFQTSASIEQRQRRAQKAKNNTKGRPVKLDSKPLKLASDPHHGQSVYVATSGGDVKKVDLQKQDVLHSYKPPVASTAKGPVHPLTSLAVLPSNSKRGPILFAGSWSTQIYAWDASSREILYVLAGGHTDFVKTLLLFSLPVPTPSGHAQDAYPPQDRILLASAGSDSRIVLWVIPDSSAGDAPAPAASLTAGTRPVLALAHGPSLGEGEHPGAMIFSGSSDAEVRQWEVHGHPSDGEASLQSISASAVDFAETLRPHHTSINGLTFAPGGDMWTASADGTVKCLAPPESSAADKAKASWTVDTELMHGPQNAVRCMAISTDGRYVITGCRDEDVWVWEAGSGDLLGKFTGHADEVTDVLASSKSSREQLESVVSVSLDGTARSWVMSDLEKPDDGHDADVSEPEHQSSKKNIQHPTSEPKRSDMKLTDEEEAELAALMEDD